MRSHGSSPRSMEPLDQRLRPLRVLQFQLRTYLHNKFLHSNDPYKYRHRRLRTFSPCSHPETWPILLRRRSKHQRHPLCPRHRSLKRSQLHRTRPHRLCRPIWVTCWHLSRLKVSSLVPQVHQSTAPMDTHLHHLPHKLHQSYLEASNVRRRSTTSKLHQHL